MKAFTHTPNPRAPSSKKKAQLIMRFTHQLATLLHTGIPFLQAFTILLKTEENTLLKYLILRLKRDIESGSTFTEALRKHPLYFNTLYCNLIEAGEQSGTLTQMLHYLTEYQEKNTALKRELKKALRYPAIVFGIALFVSVTLLLLVVPQFESLFHTFHAPLPPLTSSVIYIARLIKTEGILILSIILSSFFICAYALKHSTSFTRKLHYSLLYCPLIGKLLSYSIIARWARTLQMTFAAGIPLTQALTAAARVTRYLPYQEATQNISTALLSGTSFKLALEKTKLFPSMAIQLISIGEESGTLDLMLIKTADLYETTFKELTANYTTLLEPLLMAILGLLVGGLVIAMYLPVFKLGMVV